MNWELSEFSAASLLIIPTVDVSPFHQLIVEQNDHVLSPLVFGREGNVLVDNLIFSVECIQIRRQVKLKQRLQRCLINLCM